MEDYIHSLEDYADLIQFTIKHVVDIIQHDGNGKKFTDVGEELLSLKRSIDCLYPSVPKEVRPQVEIYTENDSCTLRVDIPEFVIASFVN